MPLLLVCLVWSLCERWRFTDRKRFPSVRSVVSVGLVAVFLTASGSSDTALA